MSTVLLDAFQLETFVQVGFFVGGIIAGLAAGLGFLWGVERGS